MSSPFPAADDLSGGRWRAFAYDDKSAWPAIAPAFERAKYLGRHDGKRGLWKFSGLGSLVNESQTAIERIVQSGWSIPMVGKAQGFFAMPWIAGRRLTQYDATNHALLAKIGRYVAESADVGLDVAEHEAAIERLAHMLYWNTRECVGEQLAERTRSLAVAARHFHVPYTYGDGRMAPYEWIETADGLLKKADHSGHDCDHTVIGRQSILWDIAGTIIEWRLGSKEVKVLFEAITRGDKNFHLAALPFYCAAYAAFKVGLMTFALENCPESEVKRIERARDRFRGQLANVLASHSRSCQ